MAQAKAVPLFRRSVYDDVMKRGVKQIPACSCRPGMALPKSRAKAATCANCGGAILTELERRYMKALPK
jgi:hypothetical protein